MQPGRDAETVVEDASPVSAEPAPPFAKQWQDHPGLDSELRPPPRYRAERYRPAGKLTGKVALITGGDSGIGRAVSLMYAREGADLVIVHLPDEQSDADQVRREVEEQGRRCVLLAGDLGDADFCTDVVDRTVREFGKLDVLVNNAAHMNSKTDLDEMTFDDWDRTFKINIYAYYHLVMAALPYLRPGAAIIATGSEVALTGDRIMVDYSASKAALVALSRSLAVHLAPKGVRVNVVAPGPTWTPLNVADQGMPRDMIADMGSTTLFGRPGQPEELAPAYVFLASGADSGFITGEVIAVTGGMVDTR
jgi:NAD(P)-dependent dehydrogenase (short-subunit alcohol dehydrogenase family)